MPSALNEIENAISAQRKLIKQVSGGTTRLIRAREEIAPLRATAFAWFTDFRPGLVSAEGEAAVEEIDKRFKQCLSYTEKAITRNSYEKLLHEILQLQLDLQKDILTGTEWGKVAIEEPPDFSSVVPDPKMDAILVRRWTETQRCIRAGAPLSALVMMGGLLEAIILSRINSMPDQSPAFKAKTAPRDRTGKTLSLRDWTLANYLDVAHELGWIGQSAKDVGVVVRDYRNYIHPAKEYSHGVEVTSEDSLIIWTVFVSITRKLTDPI